MFWFFSRVDGRFVVWSLKPVDQLPTPRFRGRPGRLGRIARQGDEAFFAIFLSYDAELILWYKHKDPILFALRTNPMVHNVQNTEPIL